MRLIGISNHGLILISFLVAMLWGLIFAEQRFIHRAQQDYQEVLRSLPWSPAGSQSTPAQRVVPFRPASGTTALS